MRKQMRVLVSLYPGYGLGDAVMFSAVLRHVAKYRPEWTVDFQADAGKHCVGVGLCANTFAYGQPMPSVCYDAEVRATLTDRWVPWGDRPSTHVSTCLREHFGLSWDRECGQYQVAVSSAAQHAARVLVRPRYSTERGVVAIHYQGDSDAINKNLGHDEVAQIAREIEKCGRTPLLIDWRNTSPLSVHCDGSEGDYMRSTGHLPTSKEWGASAEMNCAVLSLCEAFIGIDSGPAKCASAVGLPSLIVWTGHHPVQYHDPHFGTEHLVPSHHLGLLPDSQNISGVLEFFEREYSSKQYQWDDPCGVVSGVRDWLREVLT